MPIVTRCTAGDCETLTIGPFCVEHDLHVERVFVRGRPLVRGRAASRSIGLNFDVRTRALPRPSPSLARVVPGDQPC